MTPVARMLRELRRVEDLVREAPDGIPTCGNDECPAAGAIEGELDDIAEAVSRVRAAAEQCPRCGCGGECGC